MIPFGRSAGKPSRAILHTSTGAHRIQARVAVRFLERLVGLMLQAPPANDAALLITGCSSIHTFFMRSAIDIVYLNRQGVVSKCVPYLQPWRFSFEGAAIGVGKKGSSPASHVLELAPGSIAHWSIAVGDRLEMDPSDFAVKRFDIAASSAPSPNAHQRGSAMVEFAVVGPILTVLGLSLVQYGMLFFAKNQINHSAFIAARAGSVGNANLEKVRDAYAQALVPMYGGGKNATEVAQALVKAKVDVAENTQIELLNPTKQSFDDWNDLALQAALTNGARRVISNRNLAYKDRTIGATSGQTIQDANLIKLRITHGYKPVVPMVASITNAYLKWLDTGEDAFHTRMVDAGRIPVETHVTVQMQSDAFEPDNPISSPGAGNNGNPGNPGDPPVVTSDPPDCRIGGCSTTNPVPSTGPSTGPGSSGDGGTCPADIRSELSADTLFDFDSATLRPTGLAQLDALVAKANAQGTVFDSLTVTGYTDPIGTEAYNKDLSQRRANAVSNYLSSKGIKANAVDVIGAGATNLVVPESQCSGKSGDELKACYAPDRRVVVELKPHS